MHEGDQSREYWCLFVLSLICLLLVELVIERKEEYQTIFSRSGIGEVQIHYCIHNVHECGQINGSETYLYKNNYNY